MSKIQQLLMHGLSLALLLVLTPVNAEEKNQKNIADNWIMVAKPGQHAEFEAAFKEHLKYRKSKGDIRSWEVYTPTIGDNLDHYVVRFCCGTWGDMDGYIEWGKKNKVGEHFRKTVGIYVESYKHNLDDLDFTNSHWPENDTKYKYFGVVTYSPKMGHGKSINDGIKVISENAKAMEWKELWSWGWQVGGKGHLSLVFPYESYQDMTPPEVSFMEKFQKQYGGEEKAQKFFKQWGNNFKSSDYTIYVHRDDLSSSE